MSEPNEGQPHDLNRLAAFAEQRLDEQERRAVVEHVAACRDCRDVLATMAAAPAVQRRRSAMSAVRWMPLAAAAAVVVAAGVYIIGRPAGGPTSSAAPAAAVEAPTATRAAVPRTIDGKQFRLVAGEWIDASYDPAEVLPVVSVGTADERDRAVAAQPALSSFLSLGPRFTVVLGRTVYRFDLPATPK
ncbi:MAG: zf-HC2 domain-containing protein [Betaproteobacteria bacterium]